MQETHGVPATFQTLVHKSMTINQVSRPQGWPTSENFALVEEPLPQPKPGTALVENVYLSVDPYMRECMDALWDLHAPLEGRSIGRVVDSQDPQLAVGDLVSLGQYNRTEPPVAPRNLYDIVEKSLRLEGFLVRNYRDLQSELETWLVPHLQAGRIIADETIVEGFEHVVDAFLGMLRGENRGKMIVQVSH